MNSLSWRPRAEPLAPGGLVATGEVIPALIAALSARAEWPGLRLAACGTILVLQGDANLLPWIDGVRYCAPDPAAPGLWLPTTQQPYLPPNLPPDLLHAALQRRGGHTKFLLWPDPALVLPLDDSMPLQADTLAWLHGVLV